MSQLEEIVKQNKIGKGHNLMMILSLSVVFFLMQSCAYLYSLIYELTKYSKATIFSLNIFIVIFFIPLFFPLKRIYRSQFSSPRQILQAKVTLCFIALMVFAAILSVISATR
jgi:hypothetical protein